MAQSDVGTIERALAVGDAVVFVYDPSQRTFELRGSDIEILALGVDIGADVVSKRVPMDAFVRRARAEDARALGDGIDRAVSRGETFETVVAFADGAATTWLSVRGRRDDDQDSVFIVGTMRDVTAFKRLEAVHLELVRTTEAILQTSSDVISIVDQDGVIREIGSAAARVLGAEPESLVGDTVFSSPVVHPDDRDHVADVYRRLLSGELEHEESRYRIRTGDNGLRVVEGHRRVLRGPDGAIDGVVVVVTDVTEHVRLENELREAHAGAERAGRAKDELLSRVTHEMRTPLNAVIGFGKLLAGDDLDVDQHESVTQIVEAGEHLLNLVNEMLEASRHSSGAAEPDPSRVEERRAPAGRVSRPAASATMNIEGEACEPDQTSTERRAPAGRVSRPAASATMSTERRAPPGRVSRPAASATMSTERRASASATTITVLYIEDNASNLRLVERILTGRAGYTLLSATNGRTGLKLAREQRPTVVLLDLHLPDINGDVVLERLRSSPETRDTPVLMLSADATATQIDRLRALGATDYMTKPIDIERFLETLSRLSSSA